jgi:putative colanic acid biosynthesis acetyltransferase WcaF
MSDLNNAELNGVFLTDCGPPPLSTEAAGHNLVRFDTASAEMPQDDLSQLDLSAETAWVDLSQFDNRWYAPGRSFAVRGLWYVVSMLIFESGWLPLGAPKRWLLRRFGATIGLGVVIKPQVWIKYPWRLTVGDHCWIGQGVWIDNLANVSLGNHVCISQQAYLCTGSHDYRRRGFDLIVRPVDVGSGAWLGARALVLGGVTVGANAIVAAGSVVTGDVPPAAIVRGQPARTVAQRPKAI